MEIVFVVFFCLLFCFVILPVGAKMINFIILCRRKQSAQVLCLKPWSSEQAQPAFEDQSVIFYLYFLNFLIKPEL